MTTAKVESLLNEYIILEKRFEALMNQSKKTGLMQIALSLGPKDLKGKDLSEPSARTSHGEWVDEFERACEKLRRKVQFITDEMAECLEKQDEIRLMLQRAELDENGKLYCELRYIEGHSVKEITELWPNGRSDTWLGDIRKDALQKIADKCG